MATLLDFLPIDHPLRKELTPKETIKLPQQTLVESHPSTEWKPLFLVTKVYLSNTRTVVNQTFAGESPSEVLGFLARTFTQLELQDLVCGFPVESKDGKRQYYVRTMLQKHELGNILAHAVKPSTTKEAIMPVMKTGWGEKLKKYRIAANITQDDLSEKLAPGSSNIVSPAERETRKLSAAERKAFFLLINKPEDTSIPLASALDMARRAAATRRLETIQNQKDHPSIVEKLPKAKKEKKEKKERVVMEPSVKGKIPKEMIKAAVEAVKSAPFPPGDTRKTGVLEPIHPSIAAVRNTKRSAVKQAAMTDFEATIDNPNLTDAQTAEIMALFKSLTVTVLLK